MPLQRLLYHRIIFWLLTPLMAGFVKLKGKCLRSLWHAHRHRRILGRILKRIPIIWDQAIEKGSLNTNKLEQVEKVRHLSGTCSKRRGVELCFGFFAKA
jgi:hypothetical protein